MCVDVHIDVYEHESTNNTSLNVNVCALKSHKLTNKGDALNRSDLEVQSAEMDDDDSRDMCAYGFLGFFAIFVVLSVYDDQHKKRQVMQHACVCVLCVRVHMHVFVCMCMWLHVCVCACIFSISLSLHLSLHTHTHTHIYI